MASNGDYLAPFTAGRAGKEFSDPFMLPSNASFPTELETALDFCLYLYYMNPQYRRASIRVVSHFVTDVNFSGETGDERERDELRKFLAKDLDLWGTMLELGEEWAAYGNGFVRLAFPFNRFLRDPRGKYKEYDLGMFPQSKVKYHWKEMMYEVPDPMHTPNGNSSPRTVKLKFTDRPVRDMSKIRFHKLDPRYVTLQHSWTSKRTQVIWRFEPELAKAVKDGTLHQVNDLPMPMLQAIADDKDFLFKEHQIFHLKAPTISGISNYGWGLPEIIANYRSIHQLQVYKKIDEVVGLDYMLPFRIFSPQVSGNVQDATIQTLFGPYRSEMSRMIKERRKDPFSMYALPFPVTYQEIGSQGKSLTPKDLMEFQVNDLLDSMGYPAELFRGSLQVQQIPTALRLFENSFHFLHRGFDRLLKWTVERVLDYMGREQMGVDLQLPRMADDLEKGAFTCNWLQVPKFLVRWLTARWVSTILWRPPDSAHRKTPRYKKRFPKFNSNPRRRCRRVPWKAFSQRSRAGVEPRRLEEVEALRLRAAETLYVSRKKLWLSPRNLLPPTTHRLLGRNWPNWL